MSDNSLANGKPMSDNSLANGKQMSDNSLHLRSRAPKHAPGAPRTPFALLVFGLIGAALCLLLALNTASAANELRRHEGTEYVRRGKYSWFLKGQAPTETAEPSRHDDPADEPTPPYSSEEFI